MSVSSAMIFAAGFGTRMQPLTRDTPKPLIKVAGKPLLDHAVGLVEDAGLIPVINAHYRADQIAAHMRDHPTAQVVCEIPDILDTGGGLKNARPALGTGAALTLNSDAVWAGPNPLPQLCAAWNPTEMDALLMLIPIERTVGYSRSGSFRMAPDGRVSVDKAGLAYTGAQIVQPALLDAVHETSFSMWRLWDMALDSGRAFGLVYPGRWADVGTPEGIVLAEDMLRDPNV